MVKIEEIRSIVPNLSRKVYGKDLVYFDNAATAHRPQSVIDMWNRISMQSNANIHRAVHLLSSEATDAYEDARDAVKEFINAREREEIIFTSGTTASINLVAFCFGEAYVKEGDEIIVSAVEHHSNIVSWQLMCLRKKAILKVIPVDDEGHLEITKLPELITDRTKIIALTQISHGL
ncbi:MAG: aminotransferase class V-fold PLP-dependent enzyme, partial [Bacteroidales bacterium]|nr:aminotransferase class V-fold PLP-dependent enzyme [Bacteroidales bacterium]